MDGKNKIRLSLAEWKEISSGLELSPDDLSMIASGLVLLTRSQLELANLAELNIEVTILRTPRRLG